MPEDKNTQIEEKIDILINLHAYKLVENMTLTEGAPVLKRLGMTNIQIAAVFGSSRKTVSVRLAESKRKLKK